MDFRDQLQQLITKLQQIGGYENEIQELMTINRTIFRTQTVEDFHIETYEKIKNNVGVQQQKQYIYNKSGQLTRSRQKHQAMQQYCQNCQVKLDNFFICQDCGFHVQYEQKINQKPHDKIEKFVQFMTYFQGNCSVPYFVCNYLNNVLLEEEIDQTKENILIQFPVHTQTMNKKRSDIQKIHTSQLDEYQQKQIRIPVWNFKDFKDVMKNYREKSKKWQFSSYLPRDAIYLPALYIAMYDLKFELFSEEDKLQMIEIYKKILVKEVDRRNEFTIFHVLTGMIQYVDRFKKYSDYLDVVKSTDINSDLKQILLTIE